MPRRSLGPLVSVRTIIAAQLGLLSALLILTIYAVFVGYLYGATILGILDAFVLASTIWAHRADKARPTMICPRCGAVVLSGWRTCRRCGLTRQPAVPTSP